MEINGRFYGLWGQFVENKDQFIGGQLEDTGDSIGRAMGAEKIATTITDVRLEPNGTDSAYFSVIGKDFSCGFDVRHGGIGADDEGWLTFSGYMGHTWRIKPLEKK